MELRSTSHLNAQLCQCRELADVLAVFPAARFTGRLHGYHRQFGLMYKDAMICVFGDSLAFLPEVRRVPDEARALSWYAEVLVRQHERRRERVAGHVAERVKLVSDQLKSAHAELYEGAPSAEQFARCQKLMHEWRHLSVVQQALDGQDVDYADSVRAVRELDRDQVALWDGKFMPSLPRIPAYKVDRRLARSMTDQYSLRQLAELLDCTLASLQSLNEACTELVSVV